MEAKEQRQELFNHMSREHDISLLETELDEIIRIVKSYTTPPANTVTDEEIEKEIDKGLAKSDYPSYEKDSGYRSGFQACIKWMRDRLSQTPEGEGWISVEDRLPELSISCITWDGDTVYAEWYFCIDKSFESGMDDITHWMPYRKPLPKPPLTDNTKEITTKN